MHALYFPMLANNAIETFSIHGQRADVAAYLFCDLTIDIAFGVYLNNRVDTAPFVTIV